MRTSLLSASHDELPPVTIALVKIGKYVCFSTHGLEAINKMDITQF